MYQTLIRPTYEAKLPRRVHECEGVPLALHKAAGSAPLSDVTL
jgi:hypothetical protein